MVSLSPLRGFIYLGFASSAFAVVVACLNVAARLLFGMGHEGVAPAIFGRAHPRYKTPHIALIPCIIMIANHDAPLSVTTWLDEIGVYAYMLCYALVCIAALILTTRNKVTDRAVRTWVAAIVGVAAMGYTFYKQIVPAPSYPLDILPYVFLGCLALGLLGFGYLYRTNPDAARRAGTYADDLGTTEPSPAPPSPNQPAGVA
jgi:amino acid transporter